MASTAPIGMRMRRSTHIFDSVAPSGAPAHYPRQQGGTETERGAQQPYARARALYGRCMQHVVAVSLITGTEGEAGGMLITK